MTFLWIWLGGAVLSLTWLAWWQQSVEPAENVPLSATLLLATIWPLAVIMLPVAGLECRGRGANTSWLGIYFGEDITPLARELPESTFRLYGVSVGKMMFGAVRYRKSAREAERDG